MTNQISKEKLESWYSPRFETKQSLKDVCYLETMYQEFHAGDENVKAKVLEELTVNGYIEEAVALEREDEEDKLNYGPDYSPEKEL